MSFAITKVALAKAGGGQNAQGIHYEEKWLVSFTGLFDPAALNYATNSTGGYTLPKYNTTHASDSRAYVSDVKITFDDDADPLGDSTVNGVAEYNVTYAQKSVSFDPNPTNRAAVISGVGALDLMEVPPKDVNGVPFVNAAGERYANIPGRPVRGVAFNIQRNEAANPASNAAIFSNTTNDSAWYGVASNNATLGKITWRPQNEIVNGTNMAFWEVTYPIACRRDGWTLKLDNVGFNFKDSNGVLVKFRDQNNCEPTTPRFLSSSGTLLAGTGIPTGTYTANIFPTNGFQMAEPTNWASLNLPNPFA